MTEAWFSAHTAIYFSFLSLTALVATLEVFARRGKYRGFVLAVHTIMAAGGLALLLLGVYALAIGQPWYVWYALGFSGAVIFPAGVWSRVRLAATYRDSEMRSSVSRDL
jgi:hypothetical protein